MNEPLDSLQLIIRAALVTSFLDGKYGADELDELIASWDEQPKTEMIEMALTQTESLSELLLFDIVQRFKSYAHWLKRMPDATTEVH